MDETHIDDDDDDNDNSIIAEHNESSLIGESSVMAVISFHLSHLLYLLLILAYISYTFLPLIYLEIIVGSAAYLQEHPRKVSKFLIN